MKRWLSIIIAPNGEPLEWTLSNSNNGAVSKLTPYRALWEFAQTQGYELRWRRVVLNEDLPQPVNPAGRILVGLGVSKWGVGQ